MTDARAPRSVGCDMVGIPNRRWVVMFVRLSFDSLGEGCAVCPESQPVSKAPYAGGGKTSQELGSVCSTRKLKGGRHAFLLASGQV